MQLIEDFIANGADVNAKSQVQINQERKKRKKINNTIELNKNEI